MHTRLTFNQFKIIYNYLTLFEGKYPFNSVASPSPASPEYINLFEGSFH